VHVKLHRDVSVIITVEVQPLEVAVAT
jgi:hypothetical protein